LGRILDEKLTYGSHIKELKSACNKKLNLLKKLSHSTYGADRTSLLRLYHALVKSKLDYVCPAYATASAHLLNGLNSIHHTAIRIATGALRSSPTKSLLCDSSQWSLEQYRSIAALRLYLHFQSNEDLPVTAHPSYTSTDSPKLLSSYNKGVLNKLQIHLPPAFA